MQKGIEFSEESASFPSLSFSLVNSLFSSLPASLGICHSKHPLRLFWLHVAFLSRTRPLGPVLTEQSQLSPAPLPPVPSPAASISYAGPSPLPFQAEGVLKSGSGCNRHCCVPPQVQNWGGSGPQESPRCPLTPMIRVRTSKNRFCRSFSRFLLASMAATSLGSGGRFRLNIWRKGEVGWAISAIPHPHSFLPTVSH